MGSFGSFYSGEKKKIKKDRLEDKTRRERMKSSYTPPTVKIIGKGKKKFM